MTEKKKETNRTEPKKETTSREKTGADPFAEYTDEYKKSRTRSSRTPKGGYETQEQVGEKEKKVRKPADPSSLGNQIFIALLLAVAIFTELCFLIPASMGKLGAALARVLPGLGGGAALAIPILLLFHALYWKRDTKNGMRFIRFSFSFSLFFFLSIFLHLISVSGGSFTCKGNLAVLAKHFYERGGEYVGGGAVGGTVASLFVRAFGIPGAYVFTVLFLLISIILFVGLTPSSVWERMMFYLMRAIERYRRHKAKKRQERLEKEEMEAERKSAEAQAACQSCVAPTHGHAVIDESILNGSGIREGREENPSSRDRYADLSGGTVRKKTSREAQNAKKTKTEEPTPEEAGCSDGCSHETESEKPKRVRQSAPYDPFDYDTEPGRSSGSSDKKKTGASLMLTATDLDIPVYDGTNTPDPSSGENVNARKAEPKSSRASFDYDIYPDSKAKAASAGASGSSGASTSSGTSSFSGTSASAGKSASFGMNGFAPASEKKAADPAPTFRSAEDKPAAVILGGETDSEKDDGDDGIMTADAETQALPSYRFPPISLLKTAPASTHRNREELEANGVKLIETLANFNVHAKLVNISCGPTITRYEITLEAGTRVRALTNLVDDISLALATEGVRIEGVIPGKSAIGIEVPNRTSEFVYVRDLIDSPDFENAKSRLTTALGKGVAGEPVYLDVAKMPHLLIAGTTGSGKSVCINSLLISILYKARPEDVKLVLIDPKKVELNMYNGLPHLLVPVVFDPKKAAGALNWCVTEMERRFDLIEEVGAKNLETYTKAIEKDPTKERLPQIVIIIDELADLMMTAADAVETSICRIAQKARAAGMHLIVGTQRPSVDVVTGLIKANIPSRIAFTVKSQVDSRTIIDVAGAEKLVGHGDMLYAPIGSMKPIRVQGAFVSEGEIDAVIDFMKSNNVETAGYSDEVMEQIEKEAALCGPKKGKAASWNDEASDESSGADKSDPMFDKAVELAVDSGKISTSLLQRRLSLGFGRAAKLIDMMEERGIVSGPDGQKPRNVLISREQYLEMKMLESSSDG